MRRLLAVALVAISLGVCEPTPAVASHEPGRCTTHWRRGPRAVAKVVRCAGRVTPGVSGHRLLSAARCESRLKPRAYNPDGPYGGILQHDTDLWPGRARQYGFAGASVFDVRVQAFVSARTVRDRRADGKPPWQPWPVCGRPR